jgi:hypothetical protein
MSGTEKEMDDLVDIFMRYVMNVSRRLERIERRLQGSSPNLIVDTPDGPETYVRLPPVAPPQQPIPPDHVAAAETFPSSERSGELYRHNSLNGHVIGPGGFDFHFSDIAVLCRLNDLADLATKYAIGYHFANHGNEAPLKDCQLTLCRHWKRLCHVEKRDDRD